jgi:hypothetical protein
MNDKSLTDLKTFIENVNKKDRKRNGKKVRFSWLKRKRKWYLSIVYQHTRGNRAPVWGLLELKIVSYNLTKYVKLDNMSWVLVWQLFYLTCDPIYAPRLVAM